MNVRESAIIISIIVVALFAVTLIPNGGVSVRFTDGDGGAVTVSPAAPLPGEVTHLTVTAPDTATINYSNGQGRLTATNQTATVTGLAERDCVAVYIHYMDGDSRLFRTHMYQPSSTAECNVSSHPSAAAG